MKCLDTSVLIDLMRDREVARHAVDEAEAVGAVTTEINAFELYAGAYDRGRPMRDEVRAVERVLRRVDVLPLTRQASLRGAEIASALRSRGRDIGALDVLIAAIALTHGIGTIVTEDARHFRRIPNLRVETY